MGDSSWRFINRYENRGLQVIAYRKTDGKCNRSSEKYEEKNIKKKEAFMKYFQKTDSGRNDEFTINNIDKIFIQMKCFKKVKFINRNWFRDYLGY